MLRKHKPKAQRATELLIAILGMAALLSHAALADTVYRCGEAYSTYSQCANGAATEVKPTSVQQATETDKGHTATRDLREAQALEKQRLQAERQAAQAAPIRLGAPSAQAASPVPSNVTHNEPLASKGKRKHAGKSNSPYFTAVEPNAAPKKKSTAKAVPATSTP